MEVLQLKIEGDPEDLKAFQQYLFDNDPELIVNETYKHEPGFNKEPIITSIIIALGGKKIITSVQKLFDSWLKHREVMLQENNRHKEQLFKLSLKAGKSGYEEIDKDKLLQIKVLNN